ncbi:hypothetical protein I6A82_07390 [Novosphingopyxis sp. YJ-S2-01]|nr:hypothetical protein [Novosphingopyxis sp. YJ-S2-01]
MARETQFPATDLICRLMEAKPLSRKEAERFIERGLTEQEIRWRMKQAQR